MVRVILKGVHRVKKKLSDGTKVEYHYAFRGGPRFYFPGCGYKIGSADYIAAFQEACQNKVKNQKAFRQIILAYKSSEAFTKLSPRSQSDYNIWIARIDEKYGDAPIDVFNKPAVRQSVKKWRSQWSGRQAQYAWQTISRIVSWALDEGLLEYHHLRNGGSVYKSNRADIIWMPEEIQAFTDKAPNYLSRALTMATETGLRPGDIVRLSRFHIKATPNGRRILIKTNKKQRMASIPVTAAVAQVIDETPTDQEFILVNSSGTQWKENDLSRGVKRWLRKAEIREELRLYDARGSACTRLLMHDVPLHQIALIMGWSVANTAKMIEVYAALDPSNSDAVLVTLSEVKKRTKL